MSFVLCVCVLHCEPQTYFRSSLGGREATTGNASAVRRLCVCTSLKKTFLAFQSSLKTTFRTLVVSRLPSLESPDEPSALTVMAVTKERNKRGLE